MQENFACYNKGGNLKNNLCEKDCKSHNCIFLKIWSGSLNVKYVFALKCYSGYSWGTILESRVSKQALNFSCSIFLHLLARKIYAQFLFASMLCNCLHCTDALLVEFCSPLFKHCTRHNSALFILKAVI
jgi:hypothetical protein